MIFVWVLAPAQGSAAPGSSEAGAFAKTLYKDTTAIDSRRWELVTAKSLARFLWKLQAYPASAFMGYQYGQSLSTLVGAVGTLFLCPPGARWKLPELGSCLSCSCFIWLKRWNEIVSSCLLFFCGEWMWMAEAWTSGVYLATCVVSSCRSCS